MTDTKFRGDVNVQSDVDVIEIALHDILTEHESPDDECGENIRKCSCKRGVAWRKLKDMQSSLMERPVVDKPKRPMEGFTSRQLQLIKQTIEHHMYACCTFAGQAELLRDRVMDDLRKHMRNMGHR